MTSSEQAPVVIVGAGGHASVVIELLAHHFRVIGCVDPEVRGESMLGVPVLGGDEILAQVRAAGTGQAFVAIGDNARRRDAASRVRNLGFALVNAVSPDARISPSAQLASGVAVMTGVICNARVAVEELAILNTGCIIDHDCRIGAAAHVGPGVTLAGNVAIGAGAFIGAGATIIPGIRVGENSIVGAGAVVVRDVPDHAVVAGVPARPLP